MPQLSLFSPALAVALPARVLRALHARFGGPGGVDLDSPLAVARALFARLLPPDLVRALDDIARLATDLGREAILEAARLHATSELATWTALPRIDLAARVVLLAQHAGPRGDMARAVVRRARVRVGRYFSPRASYEIALPAAVTVDAVLAAAREVHAGSLLDAWSVSHEGVAHVAALHAGLPERQARVKDGAIVAHVTRPAACDLVRIDAPRSRIGLYLARPSQLPVWAVAIARAAFGDPARLAPKPAFTLRPLHEEGAAWLEGRALPASIRRVTAVGCELDDGVWVSLRSPTALADLHDRLGARGGYLVRVTLRFEMAFSGVDHAALRADVPSGETADATIELPCKLTIADARFDEELRAAIDALALTTPGSLADDLASLAPFVHATWRWIEVATPRGFEAAVAAHLLVRAPASRRAADLAHRSYGSSLRVHDLPGEDTKYALGEDLSVHAYDVAPEGTVRWRLDTARLATSLASRLHLAPPRLKRAARVPDAMLPIGVLDAHGASACVFLQVRLVRASEAGDVREALRLACGASLPAVLVGPGRTLGKGIAEVAIATPRLFDARDEEPLGDVLAELAEALGFEDDVAPARFATKDRPLVLLVERGEAWYREVRLRITASQITILIALARVPGEWMSAAALGERISPKATIVDQIARKARVGFDEKVARSFEEAGVEMPEGLAGKLIEVDKAKGRYRLAVGVVVR